MSRLGIPESAVALRASAMETASVRWRRTAFYATGVSVIRLLLSEWNLSTGYGSGVYAGKIDLRFIQEMKNQAEERKEE